MFAVAGRVDGHWATGHWRESFLDFFKRKAGHIG